VTIRSSCPPYGDRIVTSGGRGVSIAALRWIRDRGPGANATFDRVAKALVLM
jgi:hypothetical protein